MPNPADPKAIDISPEAVGAAVKALGDSRSVNGYFSDATVHKFGDMIAALSAALSEARGKVGEADQNAEAMESKWRALAPHGTCACSMDSPEDVCLHHSPKLADAIAQRDGFRVVVHHISLPLEGLGVNRISMISISSRSTPMSDEFQIGDRVEIVDDGGSIKTRVGDKGEIVDIHRPIRAPRITTYNIKIDRHGETHALYGMRLKKIAKEGLAPGDRVELVRRSPTARELPVGSIGTVRESGARMVLVEFDGWSAGHDGGAFNAGKTNRGPFWFVLTESLRAAPEAAKPVAQPAFAVGDWVKTNGVYPKDRAGTVAEIDDDTVLVEFEGWSAGHDGYRDDGSVSRWWFADHNLTAAAAPIVTASAKPELRLVASNGAATAEVPAPKPQTFIIVGSNGAATYPYKHSSRASADTEALRLARKMPGVKFTVYRAVAEVEVPMEPQVTLLAA